MRKHLHRYLIIVLLFLLATSLLFTVENHVAYASYDVTIWAWDDAHGWLSVPISMNGVPTGYDTPHTFTIPNYESDSFTVPDTDGYSNSFVSWATVSGSAQITDSTIFVDPPGGTFTAQYYQAYSVTIWAFDNPDGWLSETIWKDGITYTGWSTPYTFTDLIGTHYFTVPDTDAYGTPFTNWTTGSTSRTLVTNSYLDYGTYTAQYYQPTYSVTISAWDNVNGWQNEPIWWNGVLTIYATPHTFTGLTGTIGFRVPDYDSGGNAFVKWDTGETSSTIIVSSEGTHTAQYYAPRVATPTFSPPAGTYTSAQSVTISCSNFGATIRYTTDGSEPTSSSTAYSTTIVVSFTTTIKAKAFVNGLTDSDTALATYTINIPVKVATPTFSPSAGTYTSAQSVTISCATSGATIRYTTDGSEPSSTSTVYSSSISVSVTTTIKAKAFKGGMTDSDTASATYTINVPAKVATPTFTPPAGTYTSSQSVTISCATSGATIRYTTDGSDPTSSSPAYSGPISVSGTTTIKAKAFETGMTDSDIASATYTINIPKVATPTFNPPAGTYTSSQSVTISCATASAIIRYTTDGSDPTSSSTLYSGSISVSITTTIKAKAFNNGMTDSDTATATYTINVPAKVATPTFSPTAGTYTSPQSVTISCATSGATITYTTDGSDPTSSSTVYSSPILVSSTTTIKAKASQSGMTDSDVATATYAINIPGKCATPTFSPPAGTYTSPQSVSISCATSGATITYTVDGSDPTSSSTVYSGPISVSVTTTIKAKAFQSGMTDSDTASATYTINVPGKVATPTFSPPAGTYTSPQSVTISCATSGTFIRYTVDGSDPTSSSTAYVSPIVVSSTTTIKAKAFETSMTDSDTASATYAINIPGKVATPTFSPSAGTYSSAQTVVISCATSGATIRYTADGSEPTSSSTVYLIPISLSVTTMIKAKAFNSGMTDSDTVSAIYIINIPPPKVATPTFSPSAGTYSSAQSVTISCATSGATIRYTVDGSEPTSTSTAYSSPIPVNSGTLTVKAKAFNSGMTDSDTATATYTINPQKVSTPNLSPVGGSYSSAQSVTVSCATSEATIRYTLDGSEPTSSSTVYSIPILVSSGTVTVKAKAFKSGMIDSDTASATYTINVEPAKVAPPTMSPPGGTYSSTQNVTLSCSTEEATVRFTVDGSEPTSSSTVYSGSISVSSTTTIKAKAFKDSMADSDTATATYTINIPAKVATPTFSPPAGTYSSAQSVTINCSNFGATIRYTTDGSEPTSSSIECSSPIVVSSTTTIKAKAFETGMTDSDTATATYAINIPPSLDFSVSGSPASQTVSQGESTTYTVTVTSVGGFGGGVSLAVTGLPSGATGSFSPSTVTPTGNSTLTVATTSQTPAGTATLTITGTAGTLTHSTTLSFVVSSVSLNLPSSPMVPLWVLAAVIVGILIVTVAALIAYRSSKGRKKTLGTNSASPESTTT